jgi:hypothetical protein
MGITRLAASTLSLMALVAAGLPGRADVFVDGPSADLADSLLPVFRALESSPLPGGNRVFLVNGNRMLAQRSRTASDPRSVLDRVLYELEADDARRAEAGELQDLVGFDRPFRKDGESWGIVGRLAGPGPVIGEEGVLTHLAAGEGLGPAARGGFVVFATARGPRGGSDLWTLRFDEDFDPMRFVAHPEDDVDGGDLPGIERFPGTRRVMSFSELSSFGNRHAVAYEGRGSTRARERHFTDSLAAEGYALANRKSEPGFSMLEFSGPGGDLTVFCIRPAPSHPDAIDLIQIQPKEYSK